MILIGKVLETKKPPITERFVPGVGIEPTLLGTRV